MTPFNAVATLLAEFSDKTDISPEVRKKMMKKRFDDLVQEILAAENEKVGDPPPSLMPWNYECSCGYEWVCWWDKYSQDMCEKCGKHVLPEKGTIQ